MITLFLDTSNIKLIVGIIKDNDCISLISQDNDKNLSSKVLPLIKSMLEDSNILIDDVKRIIIVNGPGSFTGVRVGVTIAKTFAWAKQIDIIPISSLRVMATTEVNTDYIVPLIDARRDCFYAAMYDKKENNVIDDIYISRSELLKKIEEKTSLDNVTFVSYDEINDIDIILPNININKINEYCSKMKPINPHSVNPNYLKKVEAEEKLNDKRN